MDLSKIISKKTWVIGRYEMENLRTTPAET